MSNSKVSAIHIEFWLKSGVCSFRRFLKLFISTFLTWLCCITRSVKFENHLFSKNVYIAFEAYNQILDKFKTLRVEYPSFSVHSYNMALYNLLLDRSNISSNVNGSRTKFSNLCFSIGRKTESRLGNHVIYSWDFCNNRQRCPGNVTLPYRPFCFLGSVAWLLCPSRSRVQEDKKSNHGH